MRPIPAVEAAVANRKFLDTILGELRNAAFVRSRKGKTGGYSLARPAAEIMVGQSRADA